MLALPYLALSLWVGDCSSAPLEAIQANPVSQTSTCATLDPRSHLGFDPATIARVVRRGLLNVCVFTPTSIAEMSHVDDMHFVPDDVARRIEKRERNTHTVRVFVAGTLANAIASAIAPLPPEVQRLVGTFLPCGCNAPCGGCWAKPCRGARTHWCTTHVKDGNSDDLVVPGCARKCICNSNPRHRSCPYVARDPGTHLCSNARAELPSVLERVMEDHYRRVPTTEAEAIAAHETLPRCAEHDPTRSWWNAPWVVWRGSQQADQKWPRES